MNHPALIKTDDLLEWADCKQLARLKRWLDQNGIKYHPTPGGGICTTQAAIDASLVDSQKADEIRFV